MLFVGARSCFFGGRTRRGKIKKNCLLFGFLFSFLLSQQHVCCCCGCWLVGAGDRCCWCVKTRMSFFVGGCMKYVFIVYFVWPFQSRS